MAPTHPATDAEPAAPAAPRPHELAQTPLPDTVTTRASRILLVLFTLAFIASQANLALRLAPLHPSIFTLQLSFTAEQFRGVMAAWGEPGMAIYRQHFAFDYFHILIYSSFGYLLVRHSPLFSTTGKPLRQALCLALSVAGVFDLAENLAHSSLLAQQAGVSPMLVPLSATCSLIKWIIVFGFAAAVAIQTLSRLQTQLTLAR